MCGIVGVVFKPIQRDTFVYMTKKLEHRGPDAEGFWFSVESPVAFGHRRLSIIDLSPTGAQPMSDSSKRYVMTFNGEIYNFQSLKKELQEIGIQFVGTSDTEVMIEAIAAWGLERALEKANGMFALGLWDQVEKKLFLARDRFGEKPLYYGQSNGAFMFASELKPILASPEFKPEIDPEALSSFLTYSYIPAPISIFKRIYKLEPGSYLIVKSASEWEKRVFWNPLEAAVHARKNPFDGTFDQAVDQLESKLTRSIQIRSISDVPLGCFLSGGLDSSTITALMASSSAEKVSTFSIGFNQEGFNEAALAKSIAKHLGTMHTELYVTDRQALDVIPRLADMYDEPFGDSSQIPTFLVSELARKHVTVALSGDAGDELFCGYTRYLAGPRQLKRFQNMPSVLRKGVASSLRLLSPATWDSLYASAKWALPKRLQVLHFGEKLQKLARGIENAHSGLSFYQSLVRQTDLLGKIILNDQGSFSDHFCEWQADWEVIENMMIQDVHMYLTGDILTKVDRASMAVSLEARVPFLDPNLFSFAWSLPTSYKTENGQGKTIIRSLLSRYVPRDLFERPKSGFAIPIAAWLRGPLRGWAESLLDFGDQDTYLNAGQIKKLWHEHQTKRRDHNAVLWNILMFRAWEKRWFD